ncbi:DUF2637 domain-containing protein [Nocardia sp. NPDC004860]|uniref:DUF2637 domain-containing protein n=1 Tax=Nocardia sp. NPDC004860 TaxID=3154557 RepID=UPI0033AFF216
MATDYRDQQGRGLWVQCACVALVCLGAAYVSYRHGRMFALRFGAGEATAGIWPLIVDGMMTVATIELWQTRAGRHRRVAWLAFLFGVGLSLCANLASAPLVSGLGLVVAGCPPLALLLSVELLNRALRQRRAESGCETRPASETRDHGRPESTDTASRSGVTLTAEQKMWAELDRIAGTNNYGRRVLRRWRTLSARPPADENPSSY